MTEPLVCDLRLIYTNSTDFFILFNNAVFYCVIQNCIGTTVLVRGCTLGESQYNTTVY